MARGAAEAGHDVEIVFQGEAAFLFNETVAANVPPVGLPSVKDLLAFVHENRISVFGEVRAAAPVGSLKIPYARGPEAAFSRRSCSRRRSRRRIE
jgi:hypothetical protein